jgi:hypothetical protein
VQWRSGASQHALFLDSLSQFLNIPLGQIVFCKINNNAPQSRSLMEGKMDATSSQHAGSTTFDERIDKMHGRDRMGAVAFVAATWIAMLFTLFTVWPYITVPGIRAILAIAAALVLALNTAAIIAMLRHYGDDKHFIYGLDLKHLDEMRKRRG